MAGVPNQPYSAQRYSRYYVKSLRMELENAPLSERERKRKEKELRYHEQQLSTANRVIRERRLAAKAHQSAGRR